MYTLTRNHSYVYFAAVKFTILTDSVELLHNGRMPLIEEAPISRWDITSMENKENWSKYSALKKGDPQ